VVCNAAGSVQQLNLRGVGLVGILPPVELLLALPELQVLGLGENALAGRLPPSYGALHTLTELYVWQNPLQGSLPCTLATMHALQILEASAAQLTGTLCPEFWELRNIKKLRL
jgi:hypothetical protein